VLGVGYCYFGGGEGEGRDGEWVMEGRGKTYLGHPLQALPFLWNQGQVAQA